MPWNWQLPDWPQFSYSFNQIAEKERQFLQNVGAASALLNLRDTREKKLYITELLSTEGVESAAIEGEVLERESLKSSIRRHFGLHTSEQHVRPKEQGMADLLHHMYETFDKPLSNETLCQWHRMLMGNDKHIEDLGRYRTHSEPMQIVSGRSSDTRVYFEAPPSDRVTQEMDAFISWFNAHEAGEPLLGRAAIAHVYFESIHPFEDGNGRIGRVLLEKALSRAAKAPVLIAVSQEIAAKRKEYYEALGRCNRTLQVDHWVDFLADIVISAQEHSAQMLRFILAKDSLLRSLQGRINNRQEKALLRIFAEGVKGFQGGLSAENYISITKTSRATATRDLQDLVDKGVLKKTGQLRHTRYWLNF